MKKLQARHERACNSFFVHLVFYSSVKSRAEAAVVGCELILARCAGIEVKNVYVLALGGIRTDILMNSYCGRRGARARIGCIQCAV